MHTVGKILWLPCLVLLSLAAEGGMGPQQRLLELGERIASTSNAPELYLRRALIYAEVGEYRLAFADVDSAAQLGHKARSEFVRGVLLYRLGQIDQALPLFNAYLDAQPQDPAATLYRARILRDAGQLEASLRDYLSYLKLRPQAEPGDTLMAARLIVTLAQQGHAQYHIDDALALLDEQSSRRGHAAQMQRYAIELERSRCHSEQALKRLQALHDNARRSPDWHLQVAEQALLLNQYAQAGHALEQAEQRLQQRRPSASKAELEHRLTFLRVLLYGATEHDMNGEDHAATVAQYYPAQNSTTSMTQSHAHGSAHRHSHAPHAPAHHHAVSNATHTHDALQGFEQPQAGEAHFSPEWRDNISAFVACLNQQ